MGREQKLRNGGEGVLPPATNFLVTFVPVQSRDSRSPERKRKRLLRRLLDDLKDIPSKLKPTSKANGRSKFDFLFHSTCTWETLSNVPHHML